MRGHLDRKPSREVTPRQAATLGRTRAQLPRYARAAVSRADGKAQPPSDNPSLACSRWEASKAKPANSS
eukprot:5578651-Pyramimonas_sp.AAC.1